MAVIKTINLLDQGYLKLLAILGDDKAIVNAARISYDKQDHADDSLNTKDKNLIFYLLKHGHTSPFEQVVFTFLVKAPIFVARQWFRHRTHRINEMSGRYTEFDAEFYIPEDAHINEQSSSNKQGRGAALPEAEAAEIRAALTAGHSSAYETYKTFIDKHGLTRELARTILGVGFFTKFQVQIDLNNLFKFFKLRGDGHAQHEIRVYAEAMASIVKDLCPVSYEAFQEYMQFSKTFSRSQCDYLQTFLSHIKAGKSYDAALKLTTESNPTASRRDLDEIRKFIL